MTLVRYWAAARSAAGVAEEELPGGSLAAVLEQARAAHGPQLARVLERCSFLVDTEPVSRRAHELVPLGDGSVLDVLPPFAGG